MSDFSIKAQPVQAVISYRVSLFTLFLLLIAFTAILLAASGGKNSAWAEIIEIKKERKSFGDWIVMCERDLMMGTAHCKIAAKFHNSTATVHMQPIANRVNQFFIIIPHIAARTFVKIRIDRNDLILSQEVKREKFGMIPLSENQKSALFYQMKRGRHLYIRFQPRVQPAAKDGVMEITERLSLSDFKEALNYYKRQVGK